MDELVRDALVGTARQPEARASTAAPLDALITGLGEETAERRLLLAAGAWAVYRQAGRAASQAPQPPAPAPAESVPVCSPGAAHLIAAMLTGIQPELLSEALARLARAGGRLPPHLLPAALSIRANTRPAVLPVLGERGRWLAQLNPAWHWARQVPLDAEGLPENAEAIWQEGTPAQRLEVLGRLRHHDPAQARSWQEAVWRNEKADYRAQLIQTLETGLSPADEPFLEAALDDRGGAVRTAAVALLARLPGSALAARMTARADALLTDTSPPASGPTRGGPSPAGALRVTPPTTIDKEWQRDGVDATSPPAVRMGERAWWLMHTLALVPPSHWVQRFGAPAAGLITAARTDEWWVPVLEGWSRAALLHQDKEWAALLWSCWNALQDEGLDSETVARISDDPWVTRDALLTMLPKSEAEQLVLGLLHRLDDRLDDQRLLMALGLLRAPWSEQIGTIWLQGLRAYSRDATTIAQAIRAGWLVILPPSRVALALPSACFHDALRPWSLPEALPDQADTPQWYLQRWPPEINRFVEIIAMRQRLGEEIGSLE